MVRASKQEKENPKAKPLFSFQFLDPRKIIGELEIKPGMFAAHFGCGVGYFTFPIAEKVGENGTVYALDILEHKIDYMRSQAKFLGFSNITAKRADLEKREGSGIEKEKADWVIIINMLFQNINKSKIIGEAKRILKQNGRILLVEWNSADGIVGPEKSSRVSKEDLIRIIRKHGLGIAKEIEIGNFHFGLILTK